MAKTIKAAPMRQWPMEMRCFNCEAIGRIYPFPFVEDRWPFSAVIHGDVGTVGTFWCPQCSPSWGAFLLEQLTIRSIHGYGFPMDTEPSLPTPGGLPVEDIAFLESELADFLESPGPLMALRPHAMGSGPVAKKGLNFEIACWRLVLWMRQAKLTGYVTGADLGSNRRLIPRPRRRAA
jgi:hypothetical protein